MEFDLQPLTDPGKHMVELADKHAEDFATGAANHDRDGTFAVENVDAMRKSGFAAAAAPEEFGGLGVTSIHDSIVAMSRLGRSDPATALAFNMHLFRVLGMARAHRNAIAAGNQERQKRLEPTLRKIGAGELIIAVANSERGADSRTSRTLATRVDGGWRFNGSKRFATGSPAADVLGVRAQYENEAGERRLARALVPVTRPGVEILENWDGMGMRASGSHDVILTDCFVKDEEFDDIGPFGRFNAPFLALGSGVVLGLSSIFLGIAEAAHKTAVSSIQDQHQVQHTNRHQVQYPMNQIIAAENEIDLAACRGILGRAGQAYDDFYQTGETAVAASVSEEEAFQLLKNTACTKKFVTERAIGIVDRAMTLSGGSGFLNNSTLARQYRDVRAGPLMQPWASSQAVELIGKVTLGLNPNED